MNNLIKTLTIAALLGVASTAQAGPATAVPDTLPVLLEWQCAISVGPHLPAHYYLTVHAQTEAEAIAKAGRGLPEGQEVLFCKH